METHDVTVNGHTISYGDLYKETCRQTWHIVRDTAVGRNGFVTEYPGGVIARVFVIYKDRSSNDDAGCRVIVEYRSGDCFEWDCRRLGGYNRQFGVSVSDDGTLVLVQSWEQGLQAFDAKSGARVWRSAGKTGVTTVYVNADTVLTCQHEKALQLLDIRTGEMLKERKPVNDFGFYILKDGYVLCHTRARTWEIIRTVDLETVETIPAKLFPDCCIRRITLTAPGTLHVHGFRNVWDDTCTPPKMLPNDEYDVDIAVDPDKIPDKMT